MRREEVVEHCDTTGDDDTGEDNDDNEDNEICGLFCSLPRINSF